MKRSLRVVKRDGNLVRFESNKIHDAIVAAFKACRGVVNDFDLPRETMINTYTVSSKVVHRIEFGYCQPTISVEEIQDMVENALMGSGYTEEAKKYIIYREDRRRDREKNKAV